MSTDVLFLSEQIILYYIVIVDVRTTKKGLVSIRRRIKKKLPSFFLPSANPEIISRKKKHLDLIEYV